jgi:sugar phosphate isomerase/epimerase
VDGTGLEQPPVELAVLVLQLARGREERGTEPLGPVPGGPDHLRQPRGSAFVVEREVEVCVRAHRAEHVARRAGRIEASQMLARDLDLLVADARCGAPNRQRLQDESHLEQITEIVDVERQHPGALVGHVLGETQRLELPQGFADRRDAHPERARELVQPQRRARLQLPEDDRLAKLLEGEFGHRAMPDPACFGSACAWHLAPDRPTRLIRCQTLCEDRTVAPSNPRVSVSQITTLPLAFADDVRAYAEAGLDGIGVWELKLPAGGDAQALELLEACGLESAAAVPAIPSILPLPLLGGPVEPAERVEAFCASLHRLAPFRPTGIVCLTGTGAGLDPDDARATVVDGLRVIGREAESLGLRVGIEPYQRDGGEQWTIASTIPEAVALIDEAESPALGIQFDVWHLWSTPTLEEDIAREIDRFVGVHVCDWREPTRGWADRVLPGDGAADVGRILGWLDAAGWDGLYDIEIFSDNGTFGAAYPDSLWDVPAPILLARARVAFDRAWEAERVA